MKIHVLGGHGGLASGYSTTSFLINEKLLVDAGGVASSLSIEDQARIENILITHCHLDHIKDLAFLSDNCFGMKEQPFMVYTHPTVKEIIKRHLLNDIVWPDFTILPSAEKPTISLHGIEESKAFKVGEYIVTATKVNHAHNAMGYLIERDGESVLFTGDTGPTEDIWSLAHKSKNLKAIYTEVSFPNRLQSVATISDHHTAQTIKVELSKMPANIPVILTHLKPNFKEEIVNEIKALNESRIQILSQDGSVFQF